MKKHFTIPPNEILSLAARFRLALTPLVFQILLFLLAGNATVHAQMDPIFGITVPLDLESIKITLLSAAMEGSAESASNQTTLSLPLPDGSQAAYYVLESPVMEKKFYMANPSIKNYLVFNKTDRTYGRMVIYPGGLHALIFTEQGSYYIDPVSNDDAEVHRVFYNKYQNFSGTECGFDPNKEEFKDDLERLFASQQAAPEMNLNANGATKRTYKLAIATTGEFYQNANFGNNNLATAQARINQVVSDNSAKYELELAITFTGVVNTNAIYTNPATDPFNPDGDRTGDAANALAMHYTAGQYDLGHVLHAMASGGSGVAGLGVVCSNDPAGTGLAKGRGWSGGSNLPILVNGIMWHEVGHQFAMEHSFNGTGGACTAAISNTNAYEIASGTTIMSYRGNCQADNNITGGGGSDYFHTKSLEQALAYIAANGGCATTAPTGNTPPTVNANPCGGMYTIPKSTPFKLTGTGSDINGDALAFTWEQIDEDGAGTPTQGFIGATAAASTTAPLFRNYAASSLPIRYFPNLDLVKANNYTSSFEALPSVARTMNFRLTARDNKAGGGGIAGNDIAVTVSASGPFTVTAPNGGENLTAGNNTNVTWDVNGTNAFCNNVNIKLSIDGGNSYPYTLLANTPNDGNQAVTIPAGVTNTATARVLVECADNTCVVFFDISNANFTVTSTCAAAGNNICPANAIALPAGDPGLNLGLNQYFGGAITQKAINITNTSPTGPLANATTSGGNTCQTPWGTEKYEVLDFAVSTNGDYTVSNATGGQIIFSLFTAAGYNPAMPCAGTFLKSNSTGAISWGSSLTATLTACTTYKLVVWTLNGSNANLNFDLTGPGAVYEVGAGPGANYAYTYAAVNTANNQVAAVSNTSNFTALAAGAYNIYGASYYSGAGPNPATVNPATWVNQTLDAILSGGACALFSGNFKPLTITGGAGTPSIAIAAADAVKAEGNAGNTAFTFTVTRTGSTANQSTANWAVTGSGGNPADAADFSGTLPSGTVTFPAGSADNQIITVNVSGDATIEPDEGFTVTLSNPVNATITTATAAGTIQNDDAGATPSLAIAATDANKAEGNAGNTPFTFTVTRTGNTANQSTANWAVTGSGGSAANEADFGGALPNGTVIFPAGSATPQVITVNVSGDPGVEPNEGFTVTLSNPVNATITTAAATGTIQNDDMAAAYCAAGAAQTTNEKIANVQFNTINNPSTGTAGYEDFTAITTTVAQGSMHNFTATISSPFNSDQIIVWIDFNQDQDFEDAGEQVYLSPAGTGPHSGNITIPANATAGNTRMRVRLHDTGAGPNTTPCGNATWGQVEDYAVNITAGTGTPTLAIVATDANKAEGNAGNTPFTFTVTRAGSTANQSSASWAVTGPGTNPADAADFGGAFPSGTVTFPAGSGAAQVITVNVSGDVTVEPNEGFTVTLSNPVNAMITTATATGTIQNDDAAAAYCAASADQTTNEKISNVQFNTINNASTGTAGYEDFTAVTTTVAPGSTHNFTGTISNPFNSDQIIVWIDFNQNQSFADAGEQVFISPTGTGPHSGNIAIPANAALGNTRMRVRLHDTGAGPNATPCGNSTWGQVEDYTINIATPVMANIVIEATDANQPEIDTSNSDFIFTVKRTGNIAMPSTVNWAVSGSGTYAADEYDFGGSFPSGTITFPAGSADDQILAIDVYGDDFSEFDEGFTVTLSDPVNGMITVLSAKGSIINDDDCPPAIFIEGSIESFIYQAAYYIFSDGVVPNGHDAIFIAEDCIELLPDFEVELGAEFEAVMDVCVPNPLAPENKKE
ncbi:MAG: hypothetical protein KDD27_23740 [Saprospiraceae bacterium]|nr:hypothetical protein [Saprospiraceae bacterium]